MDSVWDSSEEITQSIDALLEFIKPPKLLNVWQWADENRMLSSESSAEPGRWYTDRTPYFREAYEEVTNPKVVEIVIKASSQVSKTEFLNNVAAFYIHHEPAPQMMVQPTKEMGEAWSKDRLAPMLRDSPALNKLVNTKTRDGENTILHKRYAGGHLTIAGSNSPASLASRPIRILLLDEVDRFPLSAGKEGDPVNLAKKRTTTFWNKKIIMVSTPTIKGKSRIDQAFQDSDQRYYYVPCPHCNEFQLLKWSNLIWEKGKPETAHYVCEHCERKLYERDKLRMLPKGFWKAEKDFNGVAGFYINELYSPWTKWTAMAENFLRSYKNPETRKIFVNTSLAEVWDDEPTGETIDESVVANRAEKYNAEVPRGVYVLTSAVDVQHDRLEVEVLGWGEAEESWSIGHYTLYGDPSSPNLWTKLDDLLSKKFEHELGVYLYITTCLIDTGGHHTETVYRYVKLRRESKPLNPEMGNKRIFGCKGLSTRNEPIFKNISKNNAYNVPIVMIGTDSAKEAIYSYLRVSEPGACYMHHPDFYVDEYFRQLTSEKRIEKYERGVTTVKWVISGNKRNEALDLKVYNFAAYKVLKPAMQDVKRRFLEQVEKIKSKEIKTEPQDNLQGVRRPVHKKNFVKGWK